MNATIPTILNAYPPDLRPSSTLEALGGAGGFSGASFWRFRAPRGAYALRAWPVDGPDASRLTRIHHWIHECDDFTILPIPERTLDGRSFVAVDGRLWELTRWLPGRPSPLLPVNQDHVRRGFDAVARIHRRLEHAATVGFSPGLQKRDRELYEFIHGMHFIYEQTIEKSTQSVERDLALQWLDLARREFQAIAREVKRGAQLRTTLQPCLRDLRHAHLLFDGEELTGLVDFGAMGVDSVAGDLARLIGDWFANDRQARGDALIAYEAVRPLSTIEQTLIAAFERANSLLIGAHWVRWSFVEGRTFEPKNAVAEGIRKSLDRLRRTT